MKKFLYRSVSIVALLAGAAFGTHDDEGQKDTLNQSLSMAQIMSMAQQVQITPVVQQEDVRKIQDALIKSMEFNDSASMESVDDPCEDILPEPEEEDCQFEDKSDESKKEDTLEKEEVAIRAREGDTQPVEEDTLEKEEVASQLSGLPGLEREDTSEDTLSLYKKIERAEEENCQFEEEGEEKKKVEEDKSDESKKEVTPSSLEPNKDTSKEEEDEDTPKKEVTSPPLELEKEDISEDTLNLYEKIERAVENQRSIKLDALNEIEDKSIKKMVEICREIDSANGYIEISKHSFRIEFCFTDNELYKFLFSIYNFNNICISLYCYEINENTINQFKNLKSEETIEEIKKVLEQQFTDDSEDSKKIDIIKKFLINFFKEDDEITVTQCGSFVEFCINNGKEQIMIFLNSWCFPTI